MSTKRIRHTAKFKFTIAVEAIKSDKTINQLASEHQLHPSQISQWKRQRFIGAKGLHSDSQLSYLFFHHFGLDKGSTLPGSGY